MKMRIAVTGASGFVGRAVVRELLSRGHEVHALVHSRGVGIDGVRTFPGNILDAEALARAMDGCAGAVHLVGIIRERPERGVTFKSIHDEGTATVVAAARRAGVDRLVHMSALGARADAPAEYHRTKHAGEQHVRNSGLKWTIFRPSLIHGPDSEFIQMETALALKRMAPYLFMPYFGRGLLGRRGTGAVQPVYVGDVARLFADAFEKDLAIGRSYDVGGPDRLTWPELHRICSAVMAGRARAAVPVPAWAALALARIMPASSLPFGRDEVMMSLEDNVCDIAPLVRDFGFAPQPFEQSLRSYWQDGRGS